MWCDQARRLAPWVRALLAAGIVVLILIVAAPLRVRASSGVSLDGNFSEWNGQPNVPGLCGDSDNSQNLAAFYWAPDDNGHQLDFMGQRCTTDGGAYDGNNGESEPLPLRLYIDVGNDGDFRDSGDRIVTVMYKPTRCSEGDGNRSDHSGGEHQSCSPRAKAVRWSVADPDGRVLATGQGPWGQTVDQGGLDFEWGVDFSLLSGGKVPLAMFAQTRTERVPAVGTILWTPVPALGGALLGVVFLVGVGLVVWRRG